jgi:hypothetical protein
MTKVSKAFRLRWEVVVRKRGCLLRESVYAGAVWSPDDAMMVPPMRKCAAGSGMRFNQYYFANQRVCRALSLFEPEQVVFDSRDKVWF